MPGYGDPITTRGSHACILQEQKKQEQSEITCIEHSMQTKPCTGTGLENLMPSQIGTRSPFAGCLKGYVVHTKVF